jgi:beta-N-acetylhexosaminidase
MKNALRFLLEIALIGGLLLSAVPAHAASGAPPAMPAIDARVVALLSGMTTAEKVGQLFLVSFKGVDVSSTTQIFDLVRDAHLGGVMLSAANDNFAGGDTLLSSTKDMIQTLQTINWDASQSLEGSAQSSGPYVPLLVGISQEGNGSPYDQILSGLTPLPDEMAIGATWNIENARSVGNVKGRELSTLGVNLLLGPSLDVLDTKAGTGSLDLGVRSFGSNAYWVGEMGKAYVAGLHEGSGNHLAVVAVNFPGRGDSDRPLDVEVATVRKSLEDLVRVDLLPFAAVTGNADYALEVADGMLVSHIRYQGLQGNIRTTTKPVSFDAAAVNTLIAMQDFSTWRAQGGLLVSDNLGSQAVRKFFDPTNTSFDARQVIKNAFLAGNDLLYLGEIQSSDDPDQFTTLQRTMEYFVQKYNEDPAFAQQVDQSVSRILALKFKLYPTFNLSTVTPDPAQMGLVGKSDSVSLNVAREAVTLISPAKSELDSVITTPPQSAERILFIANTQTDKQCTSCQETVSFSATALSEAVLRLYGPKAGEQVQKFRITSYTFDNLRSLLEGGDKAGNLAEDMNTADWVIFAFNNLGSDTGTLETYRKLFNNRSDLVRNKKLIGFAFDAPYFLDATDISKLTAYYGIYSKIPIFVDTAARVLFQELRPSGSLPVSVPGAGYALDVATTPDPTQIIPLMLDTQQPQGTPTVSPSMEPTAMLSFKAGDTLPIRTGIIRDHNGNPVPDGTVVRFSIDTRSGSGTVEQVETKTVGGVARTTYKIPSTGLLDLKASSEPATVSQILRVDISNPGGAITSIEPTPVPTAEPGNAPTAVPTPIPTPVELTRHDRGLPDVNDWFIVTLCSLVIAVGVYFASSRRLSQHWRLRIAILMITSSYLVYLFLASGVPVFGSLETRFGSWASLMAACMGCLIGIAITAFWYYLEGRREGGSSGQQSDQKRDTGE